MTRPECDGRSHAPLALSKPQRAMRTKEVYAVTCWRCERDVEVECNKTPHRCPRCSALLTIEDRRLCR